LLEQPLHPVAALLRCYAACEDAGSSGCSDWTGWGWAAMGWALQAGQQAAQYHPCISSGMWRRFGQLPQTSQQPFTRSEM
jgi:hypothetical protein